MKNINHEELNKLIKVYYSSADSKNKKIPLIVYGKYGVGKSAVIYETARQLANEKNKDFVDWNRITQQEKEVLIKNPENKFVFVDIRLAEMDIGDFKLPDFKKDEDYFIFKSTNWAKLLTNPKSDGILFFDELTLATPVILSSVYKIIYDRVFNEDKISDEWFIMGAGNTSEDNAYTHDLPSPIRDRGGEVMLTPSSLRNWVDNYALKHNISSKIITFLEWKPSYLHKVEENEEQKSTTERGWERLNTLLQNAKTQDEFELISGSAINEGIAREFSAFLKLQKSVDLNAIVRNPEKIVELKKDIGLLYFFVSAVSERYWDKKEKEITFNKIMDFSEVLDKNDCVDFVVLLWKMCAKERKFYSDYLACKEMNRALKDKYFRYLGIE